MTPRYFPDREFPPYTYIPGRAPHPVNDPHGHSHGRGAAAVEASLAEGIGSSAEFLWGVDLFNYGYYWEAHEAWEAVWVAAGRTTSAARFVQGLIKLAAAGVKAREGRKEGVRRHTARAQELIEGARSANEPERRATCGLAIDDVLALCTEMAAVECAGLPQEPLPHPVVRGALRLRTIGRSGCA